MKSGPRRFSLMIPDGLLYPVSHKAEPLSREAGFMSPGPFFYQGHGEIETRLVEGADRSESLSVTLVLE